MLFGLLGAYHYWFPEAFGFRLNERWGLVSALCWIFGFALAFFPLYALGIMGLPRRSVAYAQSAYVPLEIVAFLGACLLVVALLTVLWQFWISIRDSDENRAFAGDHRMAAASNGRSLHRRRNTTSP